MDLVASQARQTYQERVARTPNCQINPIEYITDVLGRIGDHPHAAIDDLLPARWRPLDQTA